MAKLLRIERAIQWIARTLVANRDANPNPEGVIDQILPVIDTFGSSRAGEIQFAQVLGGVGGVEAFHTAVDAGLVRQYLSMDYQHDDVVARELTAGRIIPTAAGFPFGAMRDEVTAGQSQIFAVRNFTVGPGGRAAVQTPALGGGAQITLRLLWVETPLGEYLRSLR